MLLTLTKLIQEPTHGSRGAPIAHRSPSVTSGDII